MTINIIQNLKIFPTIITDSSITTVASNESVGSSMDSDRNQLKRTVVWNLDRQQTETEELNSERRCGSLKWRAYRRVAEWCRISGEEVEGGMNSRP